MVSTLFAYNSEVEGTIKVGDKVFEITRTSRLLTVRTRLLHVTQCYVFV
jgi:hypothetical protein